MGPIGAFRNSLAGLLVVVGALLCFPASLALWEQRILAHEGPFVGLGQEMLDQEPVQQAIATGLSGQITRYTGVESVKVSSANISINSIVLEAVKKLKDSETGSVALIGVYRTSRRLANLDAGTVQTNGDDLVIDLRPTVREVIDRAQQDEPLLRNVQLPPNLGIVTIASAHDAGIALDGWRAVDKAAPVLIVLPMVPFLLAVIVASARGFTLFLIGAAIAGGAALRIFLLHGPLDSLIEDLVAGDSVYGDAGVAVYGRIVASYVHQDVLVLLGSVAVAVVGLLTAVVMRR